MPQRLARETKVIVNPAANKGRCGATWPAIKARLEAVLGGPVDATSTTKAGDGTAIARAAFADGCRRFVAVGGDGTLNEMINGLIADDRLLAPDIVLAQIPAGTSNALSLALGAGGHGPTANGAFAALAGTATRPVDVFRCDSQASNGAPLTRHGCLIAAIGAPATIGERADSLPLLKRLGSVAYVIMASAVALTYRPVEVRIAIDGQAPVTSLMWGAMLCNSATAGERLVLAPGARIDDGRLDLVTMGALTRREALLEVIPGLRDGSYCDHPKVRRQTLAQVSIDTARPTAVLIDGEIAGVTPLRVRVLPEPLRFAVAG